MLEDVGVPQTPSPGGISPPIQDWSASHGLSRGREAELTSVAWVAGTELTYAEWLRQGRRLGVVGRSAAWWIGDWVRYGAARYGRKYELATRVTGYEHQTLLNMVYVATRFEISRRREKLSWSHHAELAALGFEEQERWLDRATAQRLTVRRLRCELTAARQPVDTFGENQAAPSREQRTASDSTPPSNVDHPKQREDLLLSIARPSEVVICPRCGHHFIEAWPASGVDRS
jgi:hypothetical protein